MGRRSIKGSVQWLDVTRPFGETGIVTEAWTENTFVYSWVTNPTVIPNRPIKRRTTSQIVPINLCDFACQANRDCLRHNCVDRRQAIERELHARILSDIRGEVLSNDSDDGWIEEVSD